MEGQMGNDLEALLDGCVDSVQEMDGGINNFLEKQREGCFRPTPLPPPDMEHTECLGKEVQVFLFVSFSSSSLESPNTHGCLAAFSFEAKGLFPSLSKSKTAAWA